MENPLIGMKVQLHAHCLQILNDKIQETAFAIEQLQKAANLETKSSAGDKYETGRAMLQQEQDKYGQQLSETLRQKVILEHLKPEIEYENIQLGSLVMTDTGSFYIAASLGAVQFEGKEFMVISQAAPFFQKMKGLKAGAELAFNTKNFKIEKVV